MTRECGQVWTPRGVLRLQPKLEFYSRFMNVSKCFAEPVCWFTVKGFTCLQIKRGHTGPNSCLCVFFFSVVLEANILYSCHQQWNVEACIIIDAFICKVAECNYVHLLEYLCISILCNFVLQLHYISEVNPVILTLFLLNLSDSFGYSSYPVKTMYLNFFFVFICVEIFSYFLS